MSDPRQELPGHLQPDAGSLRDPGGRVYIFDDRVFRTVMPIAVADFEFVRKTPALEALIRDGLLIPEKVVEPQILGSFASGACYVLEHPRLPFISYPYEWCFAELKAAALLHLDLHARVLEHGVTLCDSSAYNVQFRGCQPIFIDHLSFRRYREGEIWAGHRQFCEQFLNPILLRAVTGVSHNAWFRGSLEGITSSELSRLLPFSKKLSWKTLVHVVLLAHFQESATKRSDVLVKQKSLPLPAFQMMLRSLRNWVRKLEPANGGNTVWSDYAQQSSYSIEEIRQKKGFVSEFAAATKPSILWDIGCNTGEFTKVALESGAKYAVGFDSDQRALDKAFSRAHKEKLDFLPLFFDAANPTPNQGWAEAERMGVMRRASADAVLALAIVHHLAISRNIPLREIVNWLTTIAPTGIIEFVPKSDPMVQALLRYRNDIFNDYTENSFENHLRSRAKIVKTVTVSATNRQLYWFQRA